MGEMGMREVPFSQSRDYLGPQEWMEELGKIEIPRQTLNQLVMNYLVTEGFKDAAAKFEMEAGMSSETDLNLMDNRINIRDAIQSGKIEEAIYRLNDLHPTLLDENKYLLFHMQQQKLIELIREQRVDEAIEFAQNHLAERVEEDPKVLQELERTMALLAFDDPFSSPFSDLLALSHRQQIASEVNQAILKAEHVDSGSSKLASCLKLLIWSQGELDTKDIKYPHMIDLDSGKMQDPK